MDNPDLYHAGRFCLRTITSEGNTQEDFYFRKEYALKKIRRIKRTNVKNIQFLLYRREGKNWIMLLNDRPVGSISVQYELELFK